MRFTHTHSTLTLQWNSWCFAPTFSSAKYGRPLPAWNSLLTRENTDGWWMPGAWITRDLEPCQALWGTIQTCHRTGTYIIIYIHLYNYIYNIHVHLDIYILYLYIHKTYFVDISNNWGRHTTSDLEVRSWGNMTARDYYRWYRWYLTAGGPVSSRIGQTSLERHKSKRGTWRDVTSHNNSKPMIVINQ